MSKLIFNTLVGALCFGLFSSFSGGADDAMEAHENNRNIYPIYYDQAEYAADTRESFGETVKSIEISRDTVKYLGRTWMNEGVCWCAMSGSGIAFDCNADALSVTFRKDSSVENSAHVAIFADGERVADVVLSEPEQKVTVFDRRAAEGYASGGLAANSVKFPEVTHIEVVKLSESTASLMGISSIEVREKATEAADTGALEADGFRVNTEPAQVYDIPVWPSENKKTKIEFIGDSITCAYGVCNEVYETPFSTADEDVTLGYAYIAAKALDADYSIVAFSGYGMYSGYTNDPNRLGKELVPPIYDKVGYSSASPYGGEIINTMKWNFSDFVPDIVVIYLGTNDATYCKVNKSRMEAFTQKYVNFISQVQSYYGRPIKYLCMLGTMDQTLCPAVEAAVKRWNAGWNAKRSGSTAYYLELPLQLPEDGLAVFGHPSRRTHEKLADIVIDKLKEITGEQHG